jgi:arginine decarboxylase
MTEHLRAYNNLWQVRGDSWCRLEEAADRLTRPTTAGAVKEKCVSDCRGLLARLSTLEPYWAYPGSPQFARFQRLFAAGSYDKFAQEVVRINRALSTESYRSGDGTTPAPTTWTCSRLIRVSSSNNRRRSATVPTSKCSSSKR